MGDQDQGLTVACFIDSQKNINTHCTPAKHGDIFVIVWL